jgi:hypothetical protein
LATTLVFGTDGRLLHGEALLAQVEEAAPPASALILTGERAFQIVRRRRGGWHFDLVEAEGGRRVACEYRPYLLRRGGRLNAGATGLALRPRRPGSNIWKLAGPGAAPIAIAAQRGAASAVQGALAAAQLPARARLLLTMDTDTDTGAVPAEALAFACWLVVQWERMPAPAVAVPVGS